MGAPQFPPPRRSLDSPPCLLEQEEEEAASPPARLPAGALFQRHLQLLLQCKKISLSVSFVYKVFDEMPVETFFDVCVCEWQTNVEIIVTEGEDEGGKIGEIVRGIGASAIVVGLHDRSFMYRLAMTHTNIASNFNCRVLAIKHPTSHPKSSKPNTRTNSISSISSWTSSATPSPMSDCHHNLDVSQIEIGRLEVPEPPSHRIPYRVCPDPYSILWRWRKRRKH
ncbi:hypothetical protein LINGRAHAP2_LOCUS17032 [Linum grandiflorum]